MAAIPDMPIEQPQVSADMPVETTKVQPSGSTDMRSVESYQAASMQSKLDGTNLMDAFRNITQSHTDPRDAMRQEAVKKTARDTQDYADAFVQSPGSTPDEIRANQEAAQHLISQLGDQVENPDLAYVRMQNQDGQLSPEEEGKLAVELAVQKMMKKTWDDMNGVDVAENIGGLLIPGNIVKDNYDLTGHIFNTRDYLQNLVLNFKSMKPEDQLKALPVLKEQLTSKLDNNFKVLSVLDALIQPGGEDDLADFSNLWTALDVADIATLGATIANKVFNIGKTINAINVARRAGNVSEAADINAGAVASENVARAANTDQIAAHGNAVGLNLTGLDPAHVEGLATETQSRLNAFRQLLSAQRGDIAEGNTYLKEGLLDSVDRNRVEGDRLAELTAHPGVEDVTIEGRSPTETTFRFKYRDENGQVFPATSKLRLSLNDVGQYEQSGVGLLSSWFASPLVWAKGALKDAVRTATRLDSQQSRVLNQLRDLQREAVSTVLGPLGLKGLTPTGRRRLAALDHVLLVGDEQKKVFTPVELRAGVDGVPLDEGQIEAYYKMRSLVDALYFVRNDAARSEKAVRGIKRVQLSPDEEAFIKPYAEATDAQASLNTVKPNLIWHNRDAQSIRTGSVDLASAYQDGLRLVKFEEPTRVAGSSDRFLYALVEHDQITELPTHVLPYRVGYVPKITDEANYFVKVFAPTRVDGVDIPSSNLTRADNHTLRAFDNKDDAEKYAEQVQQRLGNKYTVLALEDRQLEKERRLASTGDAFPHGGGQYTGARATRPIKFGLEGAPMPRISTFESLQRNIANVSKFVPRNVWRLGLEQKAINTANRLVPGTRFDTFSSLLKASPDTESGRFILKLHSQIEDWMGFPSKEERLWEAVVQTTFDKLNSFLPGIAKKSLNFLKHKDPIAAARAAAFHNLLGWFNPVQLWVQAQGAAVAVARNIFNPVEMARVLHDQTALAAVDWLEGTENIAHAARSFGLDAAELAEMKRVWTKTGLRDSILATADHAAAARGHGIAMDALSRLSDKGLLFYRAGELFNRRVSFITSFREWRKLNPGKIATDADVRAILDRSQNFMLNLSRSNRAQWQKGIFSLPTQFLQVSTKSVETVLGINGNFTAAERGKIIFSQFLLYGAAGIPLGNMGVNWFAQQMGYNSQAALENMDPKLRKALNEGFTGWATMAMFGIDIDVGQRSSLAQGVNQFVDNLLFEDATPAQMFMGAFGSVGNRFYRSITEAFAPLSLGLAEVKNVDPYKVVGTLVSPMSSWNNVSKALFMHQWGNIKDRRGHLLLDYNVDFSTNQEIAQAIGFTPSIEKQTYELRDVIEARKTMRKDVVDTMANLMWSYSVELRSGLITKEKREQISDQIALLIQSLPTNYERKLARTELQQRLQMGQGTREREWRQFRQLFNDGSVDHLLDMKTLLKTEGLLQESTVGVNE